MLTIATKTLAKRLRTEELFINGVVKQYHYHLPDGNVLFLSLTGELYIRFSQLFTLAYGTLSSWLILTIKL